MSAAKENTKSTIKNTQNIQGTVKTPSTVAYIGPTLPGVAKQNTIYNNGLPEALSAKAKEVPAVGALIVPIEKLAASSAELAKEGSALSILYRKASGK